MSHLSSVPNAVTNKLLSKLFTDADLGLILLLCCYLVV